MAEVEAEESDTNGGGEANNENELKVSSTSDEMCRRRSEIKDKLMGKYSGYITSLKHNFCKKNNKGKLPREATKILFNWWNTHYNWPYPTVIINHFMIYFANSASLLKLNKLLYKLSMLCINCPTLKK